MARCTLSREEIIFDIRPITCFIAVGACAASIPIPADARVVFLEPHKEEVRRLAEEARRSSDKLGAIEPIEHVVLDSSKKIEVRIYALGELHRLADEFDLSFVDKFFLEIVHDADVTDNAAALRNQAFLQHSKLRVSREEETERQVDVLTELLSVELDGKRMSRVRKWAAEELCNRGESRRLDLMEAAFRTYGSAAAGSEIELCRAKIELLNNAPNRRQALLRVLKTREASPALEGLQKWAIEELAKTPGAETDNVLLRFVLGRETDSTPEGRVGRRRALQELVQRGWSEERLLAAGCDAQEVHFAWRYRNDS